MALFKKNQKKEYIEYNGRRYQKLPLKDSEGRDVETVEMCQNIDNGNFIVKAKNYFKQDVFSEEYEVLEILNGTTQFRAKKRDTDEHWLLLTGAKQQPYKCLRVDMFEDGNDYTIIQDSRPIVIETGVINFNGPSTPAKLFPGLVGFLKRDGGIEKFGVFYEPECKGSVCSYKKEENGNRVFLAKDKKEFVSENGAETETQELVELYNSYVDGEYSIGELPMEFYTHKTFFDAVYESEKEKLKRLKDIYEIEDKKRNIRKLEKFEKAFFGEELTETAQKQ